MNTHPICNSPLYRSAQRTFAPLQKSRRKEITLLMCEQKPYPGWFSCRRKSYPVLAERSRALRARSGAPWVTKFGKLSIRENLVMT